MTDQIKDLMRLADEYLLAQTKYGVFAEEVGKVKDELRAALEAALKPGEPVYAFRRKGLDDFCTCDERRYLELQGKPHLFEVAIFYRATPTAQTPCHCKDRPANECPGEWEPGCDLGNNEAYAKPYPPPRLTDVAVVNLLCEYSVYTRQGQKQFARAIETAVRRSFGVVDE